MKGRHALRRPRVPKLPVDLTPGRPRLLALSPPIGRWARIVGEQTRGCQPTPSDPRLHREAIDIRRGSTAKVLGAGGDEHPTSLRRRAVVAEMAYPVTRQSAPSARVPPGRRRRGYAARGRCSRRAGLLSEQPRHSARQRPSAELGFRTRIGLPRGRLGTDRPGRRFARHRRPPAWPPCRDSATRAMSPSRGRPRGWPAWADAHARGGTRRSRRYAERDRPHPPRVGHARPLGNPPAPGPTPHPGVRRGSTAAGRDR